ncbi:MAG: hypothetical protein EOM21_21640, partial [Gammaproteobacteria bacterium]|nr:hypothetical protein [Gammaproteobacteria bacterium]
MYFWAAWNSESTKPYLDRIETGKGNQVEMTDATYNELDTKLTDEQKIFAQRIVDEFFNNDEYYNMSNQVYKEMTGLDLTKHPQYIMVVAESVKGKDQNFNDNVMAIFKSFTKQRRGGIINISRNGIYSNALRYTDMSSMFITMAKPISNLVGTLNSKKVGNALKYSGTQSHSKIMIDLLDKGYNETTDDMVNWVNNMHRNFISSAVVGNLGLLPKQFTSIITMLDPKYGVPGEMLAEVVNMVSGKNKDTIKIVKDILKAHPDYKYRNIMQIFHMQRRQPQQKVHIDMFVGDKTGSDAANARVMGGLLTTLVHPTAIGDRGTIFLGAVAVGVHNYKNAYSQAISEKLTP